MVTGLSVFDPKEAVVEENIRTKYLDKYRLNKVLTWVQVEGSEHYSNLIII